MIDKNLALRNIIANQALEGQQMTPSEISRAKAILDARLSVGQAIADIQNELQSMLKGLKT